MKMLKKMRILALFALGLITQCQVNGESFAEFLFGDGSIARFGEALEPLSKRLIEQSKQLFLGDQLFLFDGSDGANQCHINALMVVLLAQGQIILSEDDRTRFLALNLLLSKTTEGNERPERLAALLDLPITGKLKGVLKSGRSNLILHAKHKLLEIKAQFFDQQLSRFVGGNAWRDFAFETEGVAILPKFVGIRCLLEFLKNNNHILTVVKCRLSDGGTTTFLITPDQEHIQPLLPGVLDPHMPIIVIEGFSTDLCAARLAGINPELMQLANAVVWMSAHQPDAHVPEGLKDQFGGALNFANAHQIGPDPETREERPECAFSIQHMFPSTVARELV